MTSASPWSWGWIGVFSDTFVVFQLLSWRAARGGEWPPQLPNPTPTQPVDNRAILTIRYYFSRSSYVRQLLNRALRQIKAYSSLIQGAVLIGWGCLIAEFPYSLPFKMLHFFSLSFISLVDLMIIVHVQYDVESVIWPYNIVKLSRIIPHKSE